MPIGKDSITKRVAKQAEPAKEASAKEKNIAPELVATTAVAPVAKAPAAKAPAKKTASSGEKKTTTTTKKGSTAANKATSKAEKSDEEKFTPKTDATTETPVVETAVLANVSPETVAAVIGHKEDEKYEKVQIGQKMPDFLL